MFSEVNLTSLNIMITFLFDLDIIKSSKIVHHQNLPKSVRTTNGHLQQKPDKIPIKLPKIIE